jgi:hypothetical protein
MKIFWWQLGLHLEPETKQEHDALCLLLDNAKFTSIAGTSPTSEGRSEPSVPIQQVEQHLAVNQQFASGNDRRVSAVE